MKILFDASFAVFPGLSKPLFPVSSAFTAPSPRDFFMRNSLLFVLRFPIHRSGKVLG